MRNFVTACCGLLCLLLAACGIESVTSKPILAVEQKSSAATYEYMMYSSTLSIMYRSGSGADDVKISVIREQHSVVAPGQKPVDGKNYDDVARQLRLGPLAGGLVDLLSAFGNQGWELVDVHRTKEKLGGGRGEETVITTNDEYTFKRKK